MLHWWLLVHSTGGHQWLDVALVALVEFGFGSVGLD
jgi:hypothetical protein